MWQNVQTILNNFNAMVIHATHQGNKLSHETELIIWGSVIGVSLGSILILMLLHFFWWRHRFNKIQNERMRATRERGILTEIKGNIFLILSSMFFISFVIGIITIVKLL